jgi:hypothetical protein
VQTEELSLPDYLAFLRTKIAHHEQLVRALTDRGRSGDARAVSERVKIMQDEVDSAAGM